MFDRKGVIIIEKKDSINEDTLMEDALEAGMEDMITYDDSFYITTSIEDFNNVCDSLRSKNMNYLKLI